MTSNRSSVRRALRAALLLCGSGACALIGSEVVAQTPIEASSPATPIVMVVIDTSGSMEFTFEQGEIPICVNDNAHPNPRTQYDPGFVNYGQTRMHLAQSVLTGSFQDPWYCYRDERDSMDPYVNPPGWPPRLDTLYPARPQGIPHLSMCSNITGLPADENIDCTWTNLLQNNDGIIDRNRGVVNFGFVTYDSFPEADPDQMGMYSWGADCLGDATAGDGACSVAGMTPNNMGIRRPSDDRICNVDGDCLGAEVCADHFCQMPCGAGCPAGEFCYPGDSYCRLPGGLVHPINPYDLSSLQRDMTNNQIERSILSTVPYWSTPISGTLTDLELYFTDAANDVIQEDPYLACREYNVIYVTDGIDSYSVCDTVVGPCAVPADCVAPFVCSNNQCVYPGCEGYWLPPALTSAQSLHDIGVETYVIGYGSITDSNIVDALACAGDGNIAGCRVARQADNETCLGVEFQTILNRVIGGISSRTPVVTTARTQDWLDLGEVGQYRFSSRVIIDPDSPYWTGQILRTEFACDTDLNLVQVAQTDPFSGWLNNAGGTGLQQLSDRVVYTSSPGWHSCLLHDQTSLFNADTGGTVPADIVAAGTLTDGEVDQACCDGDVPGSCVGGSADAACVNLTNGSVGRSETLPDAAGTIPEQCLTAFDVATFTGEEDVLDVDGQVETNGLEPDLNETSIMQRTVRWTRGDNLVGLAGPPRLIGEVICDPSTDPADIDRTSRLADIFHSTPAIVGGADVELPINSFEDFRNQTLDSTGDPLGERPTMLYSGGGDGMLHAFDAGTGEELWGFIPPSLLPRLQDGPRGHQLMIDGAPVVRDIRVYRNPSDPSDLSDDEIHNDEWRTVLVVGYRGGSRGYMAIDVTDPGTPFFLWELDSELDPQLGFSFGEAALGTVFIEDCGSGPLDSLGFPDGPCERGVAILGGGLPEDGLATWRDPGSSQIGRVLYVVDLMSGLVLHRFSTYDPGTGPEPFEAPFSGSVAAYDDFASGVITRAFIGDAAGRLIRLDLTEGDPTNWSANVFFDPRENLDSGANDCTCAGQMSECLDIYLTELNDGDGTLPPAACNFSAVYFRPTIALSHEDDTRAVVLYGFGSVDELESLGEQNYVVSLVEIPELDDTGLLTSISADTNWILQLETGEKLTGRPRVFNRTAFFATFVPNSADLCEFGASRVYGLDYMGDYAARDAIAAIGTQAFTPSGNDTFIGRLPADPTDAGNTSFVRYWGAGAAFPNPLPDKSVIFGVEIVDQPTCVETSALTANRGNQSSVISRAVSGRPVLVVTPSYTQDGGGVGPDVGATQTITALLPEPEITALPSSWGILVR